MEDFEGKKEIINLFNSILGSKVSIKDNMDKTEESIFVHFVNELDKAQTAEHKLFENSKIEINHYTDPLWNVIENILKLLYGEEQAELIQWYIYDRFNADGSIVPIEDESGKKYIFTNPEDLWSYMNYRYSKK
jgi:hypothetical protein